MASRPEWPCFIFARTLVTTPTHLLLPPLPLQTSSAVYPRAECNHNSVFFFYWVFHGQPGCLELPTSSPASQWRENTSSGTFMILPQFGPLALGLGCFIQTSPTASPLSVPGRHRLGEAHWPGSLGSRLRPEIHGGSCPSEATSNPPQHSRIGSGLQFGVEVEKVRCRIGCDGRHVPGRRSWTQSVSEDSVIGRGREMHQAGSHR